MKVFVSDIGVGKSFIWNNTCYIRMSIMDKYVEYRALYSTTCNDPIPCLSLDSGSITCFNGSTFVSIEE